MKHRKAICLMVAAIVAADSMAQTSAADVWQQRNMVAVKASQLYYEAAIGINVTPQRPAADIVYMAFGYGRPTRRNAWRKFMPAQNIPQQLPKSLRQKLAQTATDHLHAGMVAVGWNHWFNHSAGLYLQAGWGFIADMGTGDDLTDDEKVLLADSSNGSDRATFIYNTVPVELGLTLNLWTHYNVQAGVTYMWKEIPLLTVGLGYAF